MPKTGKPLATALNEVTVTIMDTNERINYHETFIADLTQNNSFEFDGFTYNIPAQDTMHYPPSFWRFDVKLAMFFELHKTWASLLDWFNFRNKAVYEVGFLYWKNNADPENLEPPKIDWALENYKLQKNSSVERTFKDVDAKLAPPNNHTGSLSLALVLIIVVIAIAVVASMVINGNAPGQQVQNITQTNATIHPILRLGG